MTKTSVSSRPKDANSEGSGPLGTTCKIIFHSSVSEAVPSLASPRTKPPDNSPSPASPAPPEDFSTYRFYLQSGARRLLPDERVSHCCRRPLLGQVEVRHSPSKKRAIFAGLETCSSVWMCPVCAARISEFRRRELAKAVLAWRSGGGRVFLVTYTVRHRKNYRLETCYEQLLYARKLWKSGRFSQQFRDEYQQSGTIYSVEVTHGSNGWHPHIHELAFLSSDVSSEEYREVVSERWQHVVSAGGMMAFRPNDENGVTVEDTNARIAEYVTKFGHEKRWGEVEELTKAVSKRGKWKNRGPMGLLEDYCRGDEESGKLFREYAYEFKGHKQLFWSRGLRALLLPEEEEVSDEAVVGNLEEYPVLLALLSLSQWKIVLARDARADVLRVAHRGDEGLLWGYLRSLGIEPEGNLP